MTGQKLAPQLARTADFIARTQRSNGAIPWFDEGILDPWDHVEAAMGLSVAGYIEQAAAAFAWLAATQNDDGSWWAGYDAQDTPTAMRKETNFVAYFMTGVWHLYRVTGQRELLERFWPNAVRALNWVLNLQTPHGEIYWAVDQAKGVDQDALVTGCSSIYKSLDCAAKAAIVLDEPADHWLQSARALHHALLSRPDRFDRTWDSKARYAMDWFYPVMTGVLREDEARQRLDARWSEFVEPDLGCRCVSDEPWVTMAETCELIMACCAADRRSAALTLWQWISRFQAEDGSWWTGFAFKDQVLWPDERPTWTAGAILLAADALHELTPAHNLFGRVTPSAVATPPTSLSSPKLEKARS